MLKDSINNLNVPPMSSHPLPPGPQSRISINLLGPFDQTTHNPQRKLVNLTTQKERGNKSP